jgi:ATP-dependent Clp protease protease subunit
MDYSKEFKKYSIKHHGINSLYYDKLVSSMTPYIIEERQLNVAQMDVFFKADDGQNNFFRNWY